MLAGIAPIIVPLFSPRTAQIFVAAAEPITNAPLYVVALSAAVAWALGGLQVARLETAAQPTAEAMIAAIGQIAENFPVA